MTSTRISSGGVEAEGGGVADVEFEDFVAFFFELEGFFVNRAADVVADVVEFGGFGELFHGACSVKRCKQGVNVLCLPRDGKRPSEKCFQTAFCVPKAGFQTA